MLSLEQKRLEKKAYDAEYRKRNREMLKDKKAAYFQRTYDPKQAAEYRKKRMPIHVEYCRNPEYREKKKAYDRKKEEKRYGEWAEAWRLLQQLIREINIKQPDRNERYREAKRYQWNPAIQQRRRRDAKARREAEPNRP